nr:uncharacterized protein LOC105861742 [Microcebus murinus]
MATPEITTADTLGPSGARSWGHHRGRSSDLSGCDPRRHGTARPEGSKEEAGTTEPTPCFKPTPSPASPSQCATPLARGSGHRPARHCHTISTADPLPNAAGLTSETRCEPAQVSLPSFLLLHRPPSLLWMTGKPPSSSVILPVHDRHLHSLQHVLPPAARGICANVNHFTPLLNTSELPPVLQESNMNAHTSGLAPIWPLSATLPTLTQLPSSLRSWPRRPRRPPALPLGPKLFSSSEQSQRGACSLSHSSFCSWVSTPGFNFNLLVLTEMSPSQRGCTRPLVWSVPFCFFYVPLLIGIVPILNVRVCMLVCLMPVLLLQGQLQEGSSHLCFCSILTFQHLTRRAGHMALLSKDLMSEKINEYVS